MKYHRKNDRGKWGGVQEFGERRHIILTTDEPATSSSY